MARMGWCWAALALAVAPAAAAETEIMDNPDTGIGLALGADVLRLPLPALDAPNPVVLAVDAADALGLELARRDAEGMDVNLGPVPYRAHWMPGIADEGGVHTQPLLAFTQTSDAIYEQALGGVDDLRGKLGLALPGKPHVATMPRFLLDLDAARLRLGTEVELVPSASVSSAEPGPPGAGVAGLASAGGTAGFAVADAQTALLAPSAGDGLASGALVTPAPVPATPMAAQASGVAPAGALPQGAAIAGLVVTGLLVGALALYHLVNRNNIFENDVRMQVYDVVARNPGVTIQEVARVVGLSHPTARYHLNVLAKNDLVVYLDKGNKMMFFRNRNEFSEQEREVVAILRNPEAMKVYASIERSPWILRKEISEALGISRTSVNWHLRSLMRAGLVAETREQGKGFLFARREGCEALSKVYQRVHPAPPAATPPPGAPAPAVPAGTGQAA